MKGNEILIKLRAENKQLKAKLSDSQKNINKLEKGTKKSFGGMAKYAAGFVVALGVSVLALKKAVSAASRLEETASKFNTVFGDSEEILKKANEAVDELRKNYAMSEREAREYMAAMQDLLVPMGMASDEAGEMSAEIVKLAADLGSFNDMPTAEVMSGIQSALVGNYETMKRYGVVLNESRVQQEAMNMKLWDGKGKIDAVAKSQAAYSLILKGTEAAQGDMIRTGDGYANTLKKIQSFLEDTGAEIGKELLPGLKALFNSFLIGAKGGGVFIESLKGIVGVISSVLKGYAHLINMLNYVKIQYGSHKEDQEDLRDQYNTSEGAVMDLAKALRKDYGPAFSKSAKAMADPRFKRYLDWYKDALSLGKQLQKSMNVKTKLLDNWARLSDEAYGKEEENVKKSIKNAQDFASIEKEKQKAIEQTGEAKKSINAEYYDYIGEKEQAELTREEEKYAKLLEMYSLNQTQKEEMEYAHQERMQEIKTEFELIEQERRLENMQLFLSTTQQLIGQISNIYALYFKNQSLNLDKDYKKRKKHIIDNVKDEGEQKKQLEALDVEYDKKRADLAYKQAKVAKKIAVTNAIMNTAVGMTKALSATPFPPINAAFAAIIGALGAVQIALIAKQPLPEHSKGKVPYLQEGYVPPDHYPALIGEREAVINAESTRANEGLLRAINESPGVAFGGGESESTVIHTHLDIDGAEVASIVDEHRNETARRQGAENYGKVSGVYT